MQLHLNLVLKEIPSVEAVLITEGLVVTELFINKTGMTSKWSEGDHMKVSLSADCYNKKIRFILDKGCDKHGRGKNQKQLREKSHNLEGIIKCATGLTSVKVNPFSFEIKEKKDTNSILIDFWVK